MKLDLTGWDEVVSAGEPLSVRLDRIRPDPGQPRKQFDQDALQALADSIRTSGVLQPISLRHDPDAPGDYIINYGERRYRAAGIAGLETIPALIHKSLDSYDQVVENLHRADLTPMELALFIDARLKAGERKGDIAARLGHNSAFVTEHLALLEAPPCIELAYAGGVKSVRTLYDLRRLHDQFPRQVEAWCASGAEITRRTLAALAEKFSHDEKTAPLDSGAPALPKVSAVPDGVAKFSHDEKNPVAETAAAPMAPAPGFSHDEKTAVATPPPRMLIEVEHDGRKAIVQQASVIQVLYEGEATSVAIPLTAVKILRVFPA